MLAVLAQLPRTLEALDVDFIGIVARRFDVPSDFLGLEAWLRALPPALVELKLVVPLYCRGDRACTFFGLAPSLPSQLRALHVCVAKMADLMPALDAVLEFAACLKLSALPRTLERLVCTRPFCALGNLDAVMPRLRHLEIGRLSRAPHDDALFPLLQTTRYIYAPDVFNADALARLNAADLASCAPPDTIVYQYICPFLKKALRTS